MLRLHEVVKHFTVGDASTVRAVDGVSLGIEPGELVALYGPSGSGKTTLLSMIAALSTPDSGSIELDGRDVVGLGERDAARYRLHEVGFVRQSFNLLPNATALDNAALKLLAAGASMRQARKLVEPKLARLGLSQRLGQRGRQLSMGERQRVMIARALSMKPKLVLADEPTGNLDTRRGHEVLDLLASTCRDERIAMLLVTHDPKAADYADRAQSLHDGRLVVYQPEELHVPGGAP